MKIDDLIENFVEELDFDMLIGWADILEVDHDKDMWFDDMWPDRENDLRINVAEAMGQIGKNKDPYRHYNKAREMQLEINQFNKQNEDGHYD